MDIVEELRAFVATAQTGSFTAAAERIGISNRLTSKYVASLEARLGVRLFQRTTRRVGLTPAGEELVARAPALLDELDSLLADMAESSRGFSGVIRISAPLTFGETYLAGMLARFGAAHPGLSFDLRLDDRYVDLAREGIDLAFRMGRSETLSLKTRRLGTWRGAVVASPGYLARHGTPRAAADLAGHHCIIDTNRRKPGRWAFRHANAEVVADVAGAFHVNSARAALDLAIRGIGIAYVPRFALEGALRSGTLVALLEDHEGESGPLDAVWLEGRALPRKVRALIDFAIADIRGSGVLTGG